jgi:acetyl-CoA carboxylase carboxyltransferase component
MTSTDERALKADVLETWKPGMPWEVAIKELEGRRRLAQGMGGPERVARQHAGGKLTIRERVTALADPGTFFEMGTIVGEAVYDEDGNITAMQPGAFVHGLAEIGGRPAAIGGEDFTISGGSPVGVRKGSAQFMHPMALQYGIPQVYLADGAGATAKGYEAEGRTMLPDGRMWWDDLKLLRRVPVVSAVLGAAAGHVAGRALLCHFSVMTKGTGQIFAAGPPVVERALGEKLTKDELGGTQVHVRQSGVIDNEAEDEADAFRQVREFLSYMPSNVFETAPRGDTSDSPDRREQELLSIIPPVRARGYDMRRLISLVVDHGAFFEMRRYYGASLITAFARMHGHVVGVIANNPRVLGGAMDGDAADKQTHFVDLCDAFNIPLVLFVDTPGFMIGRSAERSGALRRGMRALVAGMEVSVPKVQVNVRRSYGMAGDVASGVGGGEALNLRLGWPAGEWGGIPIEGGVAAAYRREIENAPDPEAHRRMLEERLQRVRSPFRSAEAGSVTEMIDPRETRPMICRFVDLMQPVLARQAARKLQEDGQRPVRP